MSYRNQIMEWSGDYIRKERAAEIAAAADAEIAALRDALAEISEDAPRDEHYQTMAEQIAIRALAARTETGPLSDTSGPIVGGAP